MPDPLDEVEIMNSVRNMAKMAWVFFTTLQEEGFDKTQALGLTGRWLHGMAGGKSAE